MHKCQCGQEFEGEFCPNCGAKWHEEKTCPKCGTKLNGSVKFCNNCGYSFVKPQAKEKKSFNFLAWFKSHLKIVIPVAILIALIIILSCTIPACVAGQTNGTYYKLQYNGELDKKTYFVLNSGKWEDEDGESGNYKKDGEKITFYYTFFGETEEIATGALKDYVLKVNDDTFISEKHKHNFGEWEVIREVTDTTDGLKTRSCACGIKESETLHATGTKGLNYELNQDGTGYILTGIGSATNNTEIGIPRLYNGLPVTAIGSSVFDNCHRFTNITIPDSVTSIGNKAFWGCSGLTSVKIPDSVTFIGEYAFGGCSGLTSITVSEGNTAYHSSGNCLIETESKTLILGCKTSIIPTDGSVASIGKSAFYECSGLTSVTIPNSVTSIGQYAFFVCYGLTRITIPDSVTSIGYAAFLCCGGLTSVTIPDSMTSIGEYVFGGCDNLTSVTIHDSVTSFGNAAFSGCSGLTRITFKGTKAQWGAIEKGDDWNKDTGNYTIYCTDGTISKADD